MGDSPDLPGPLEKLTGLLTRQGRLSEAESALRRFAPDGAMSPAVSERLANLLALQGKTEELEKLLRDCARRRPNAPEPRNALAAFLIRHDRLLEAVSVLGRADGRAAAELAGKMKSRIETLIATERFAEAEPMIASLLSVTPKDPESLFLRGRWLRHQDRHAAAAASFREAARIEPRRMRTYLHWAEAVSRRPGARETSAVLRRALELCPAPAANDAPELIRRHLAALYAFDFQEAAALGEKVLDRTRGYEDLRTLGWVCLVYDFRNDQAFGPPEAISRKLEAYLRARPRGPWGLYWKLYFASRGARAAAPERQAGTARALAAAARGKRHAWMRYEIGKWRFGTRDYRGAARDFQAALRSSEPPNWRAQCWYAETLWCLGDKPGALEAFRRAEQLAPESDRLGMRTWQGEVLLWGGEYAAALPLLRGTAAGIRGAQPSEGAAFFKLRRPSSALEYLERTIARNPSCVEARIWRAEALMSQRRLREASAELAAAAKAGAAGSRGPNFYRRVVGALVADALGKDARARAEFRAVPARVRAWAKKQAGLSGAETAADRRLILEQILESSRGVRSEALLHYWLPADV